MTKFAESAIIKSQESQLSRLPARVDALIEIRKKEAYERQLIIGEQTLVMMSDKLQKTEQSDTAEPCRSKEEKISSLRKYMRVYQAGHDFIRLSGHPGTYRSQMLNAVAAFYYYCNEAEKYFGHIQLTSDGGIGLYTEDFLKVQDQVPNIEIDFNGKRIQSSWNRYIAIDIFKKYFQTFIESREKHLRIWELLEIRLKDIGIWEKIQNLANRNLNSTDTLKDYEKDFFSAAPIFVFLSFDSKHDFELLGADAEFFRLAHEPHSKISEHKVVWASLDRRFDDPRYGKFAHLRGHDFISYNFRLCLAGVIKTITEGVTKNAKHEGMHGFIDWLLLTILDLHLNQYEMLHEMLVVAIIQDDRYLNTTTELSIKEILNPTLEKYAENFQAYAYRDTAKIFITLLGEALKTPNLKEILISLFYAESEIRPNVYPSIENYDTLEILWAELLAIIFSKAVQLSNRDDFNTLNQAEKQKIIIEKSIHSIDFLLLYLTKLAAKSV